MRTSSAACCALADASWAALVACRLWARVQSGGRGAGQHSSRQVRTPSCICCYKVIVWAGLGVGVHRDGCWYSTGHCPTRPHSVPTQSYSHHCNARRLNCHQRECCGTAQSSGRNPPHPPYPVQTAGWPWSSRWQPAGHSTAHQTSR